MGSLTTGVEVRGLDVVVDRFERAGEKLHRELDKVVMQAGLLVEGEAHRQVRMGGPKHLSVRTGRLTQSIRAIRLGLGVVSIGTNVVYARIHEEGGVTAPHVILPKNKKALAFTTASGERVIVRRVNHPGSRVPSRPYLRPSLEKKRPPAVRLIQRFALRIIGGGTSG